MLLILYPHGTYFEQLGQAQRALTAGIHRLGFGLEVRGFGLEVRDRVLGLKDINFRGNEALACQSEMPRLGGPPERSEGGEGHQMVGPLHANEGKECSPSHQRIMVFMRTVMRTSPNVHQCFWSTPALPTNFPSLIFDLTNLLRHATNFPHQMTKILILRSDEVVYDSRGS
jgi:hypothetical protein